MPTGIAGGSSGSFIPDCRFYSNYPNPFNPSTAFRLRLNRTSAVRMEITDIRGRVVDVIVSERLKPGRYVYHWNAANRGSKPVPSGMYFAVLKVGEQRETQKLTLIR
ncbi:MAG: T9SS type A sorting domain-containing protein [Candidatus Marinimicrobia bacterium]|nr:T9SS type A sorting domain-containing protein [Candidatus Neomarinimicrobiota bacterium]MCF7830224.1 T9SS type A sorting domain-containing protein [Candidatus Neomarinimicrobiota bacterium]MCF7880841.1 T9SS type A sorting domain-containing protein [Candidatus Neomarinimicrobiota bacterium]